MYFYILLTGDKNTAEDHKLQHPPAPLPPFQSYVCTEAVTVVPREAGANRWFVQFSGC